MSYTTVHDGVRAARVMLGFKTWRPGYCLEAVVAAYRQIGVPSLGRPAPTAYVGWQQSDLKHPGDRNPPPGVPVWWGPKASSAAGDVVISLGGGQVVATDWPRSGVIGVTTIDARERQIGRPYLGWTEDILGVPVYSAPSPAGADTTSTIKPETTRKRRRETMIHAAWRDDNGTIAVQYRPNGKITMISDPYDWNGISAGSGAGYAQISNAKMQELVARYGTVPYPLADTGRDSLPVLVYVREGNGTVYLFAGGKLKALVDPTTLQALHDQGAASVTLSQAEVDNLLAS